MSFSNKKLQQRIIKNTTPVFAYTNINAPVVKELSSNETVVIGSMIQKLDHCWYEVIFPDNKIGYILDDTEFEKDFIVEYLENLEPKTPLWHWYENPIYGSIITVMFIIIFVFVYSDGVKNTLAKFDNSNIIAFKINKAILIKTSSSPIITYETSLSAIFFTLGIIAAIYLVNNYSFLKKQYITICGLWVGLCLLYLLPGYVLLEEDYLVVKGLLTTKHYQYEQISNINVVKVISRGKRHYRKYSQVQLFINNRTKMILADDRDEIIFDKFLALQTKVKQAKSKMD